MLHVVPGSNSFALTTPSFGTARPASANGTSVTPAVGSKGAWVQLGSDFTEDAYGLLININTNSASAASRATLVDIGIDPLGGTAYQPVINNLLAGGASAYTLNGLYYYFPLFIPAGASVAARAQSTVVTALRVGTFAMQRANAPHTFRRGCFTETYGVTTPPDGTAIVPGTTSEGAWTQVGTTAQRVWWWQAALQVNAADVSWNAAAIHIDVAVGDATNKDIIIQDMLVTTSSAEAMINGPLTAGVEFDTRAGTNVYMRAQHSGTLDAYTGAVYALGG